MPAICFGIKCQKVTVFSRIAIATIKGFQKKNNKIFTYMQEHHTPFIFSLKHATRTMHFFFGLYS